MPSLNMVKITTIDDVQTLGQKLLEEFGELITHINMLAEYKHPLSIRRGMEKGVKVEMDKKEQSKTLKAGSRTYFLDLQTSQNGDSYLKIAESRFKGTEKKGTRNTILIFPEAAEDFAGAVRDMVSTLVRTTKT